MPKLLGLDLSTSVGWALLDGKNPPTFGTVRLGVESDFTRRMAVFGQWLEDQFVRTPWDAIAWEKPILMRTDTPAKLEILYGLVGVAAQFAGRHRMRWDEVTVDEVKYAVYGEIWKDNEPGQKRKRIEKADMVWAARHIHDWQVSNDHEADAIGVGIVAFEEIYG